MNELPLHILVIDDEPRLSGQLRLLLEGQGYSVVTAVGGAAGIAVLQASDIDAILTDVTMPDVDGYAVLQWVRENRPDTPVIVMTGYGSLESATRALRLGAYDYVLKPFSLPTVQAALHRAAAVVAKRRADGQRTAELAAVAAIAHQMGRSLEPTAMADATLAAITESTGARAALLFTVAENGVRWNLWRHVGLPDEIRPSLTELFPPSSLSKAAVTWEERPPWLAEAPYTLLYNLASSQGKVAWAATPLEAGPQTSMALLLVGSGRTTMAWSAPLLLSLGNALSMALVNTRLFTAVREERDRLRMLYGISRDLATALDPDQLLSRIIQHTVAAVNAERGSIIISTENGQTQRIVARYGMNDSVTESVAATLMKTGLSGWVVQHREAARIADVRMDKRWLNLPSTAKSVRSALAVPLLREDQVLGVMTLTHPRVDHFTSADVELVRSVSAQAAVAIENANLFAELEQRVFDLEGLNTTSRELASALDPMDVARRVARRCAEMLNAPMVALLDIHGDQGPWPMVTLVNDEEQPLLTLGPVTAAFNAVEPVMVNNAGAQIELLANDEAPLGESWLGVPLLLGDAIDGLLIAADHRANAFDAYERQLLTALAGQAAVAMESARLYVAAAEERTILAAVIEAVSDGILLTDKGVVVVANPAAGQIVGIDHAELLNQPLSACFAMLPELGENSVLHNLEVPINQRVYAVNVAPLRNPTGTLGGQVVVLQDITHFKELDALKSRFVSTVSHDLKSPLTAIKGYAQLVADGHMGTINDMQRDALQAVVRNSGAMTNLISDLLDLGKIEAGIGLMPQPTDLAVLIREVVDEMQMRAKLSDLSIEQSLPKTLPLVADPLRIRQVLNNLISNAIKYTPAGGRVQISASNGAGYVQLAVEDSGLGIPPDALPHVFDRFYRVPRDSDSSVEGTGLGLAITKSIVEEHGGSIEVVSTLGEGSTFKVRLPVEGKY
jgi:signal transduction histidine kinase/CheY-like chemotaxis protein